MYSTGRSPGLHPPPAAAAGVASAADVNTPCFPTCETPQEAIEIFDEMHEAGVLPGLMTYNTLIAGCVRAEHPNEALSVFKLMKERNIKRDQVQ